jgi:hypothetical protein
LAPDVPVRAGASATFAPLIRPMPPSRSQLPGQFRPLGLGKGRREAPTGDPPTSVSGRVCAGELGRAGWVKKINHGEWNYTDHRQLD